MPKKKFNITAIDLDEVSFVGKGANQEAHVVLMKRGDIPTQIKSKGGNMPKDELQKKLDDLQKGFDDLQKKFDDIEESNKTLQKVHDDLVLAHDKLEKDAGEKGGDKVDKTEMSAAVRKQFDDQETELKKQADVIAKMQDVALTKAWIVKAAGAPLVASADDLGALLKSVAETSPDTAEALLVVCKAADARIAKGNLFKELGTGGEVDDASAAGKLNKLAHETAKADGITFEKAYSKVYKANKKLAKQYLAEKSV